MALSAVTLLAFGCGKVDIAGYSSKKYASPFSRDARSIVSYARSMIGVPYRYGGNSPYRGFDCSGLVYHVFRRHGIWVPRTARAQAAVGRPVPRRLLKPGDLVFFWSRRWKWHVGIYIGGRRFVHAPRSGKRVGITSLYRPYYRRTYQGARRVLTLLSRRTYRNRAWR